MFKRRYHKHLEDVPLEFMPEWICIILLAWQVARY